MIMIDMCLIYWINELILDKNVVKVNLDFVIKKY